MDDRLAFAIETARAAGKATMEWYQRDIAIERKADDSPSRLPTERPSA